MYTWSTYTLQWAVEEYSHKLGIHVHVGGKGEWTELLENENSSKSISSSTYAPSH